MYEYTELKCACDDMLLQDKLYQPTVFWDDASKKIVAEIATHGINNFRSLPTTLGYFVPTYGIPGNCFTKEMASQIITGFKSSYSSVIKPQLALQQFLSGEMAALSDYRVLLAADDPSQLPHLHTFSESTFGEPVEQFEFEGRKFSRSSLNYLLGLAMLKKHLKGSLPKTVLELGGGFGTLGEVLSYANINGLRYIDIDIPPMSFVSQVYLSQVFGKENIATYDQTKELATVDINTLPKASVLCSWQIEKLKGTVDLFVNFISFQEMEPLVVKNYLSHVARLQTEWILLRNMREGKNKKKNNSDVGVETPILSEDYMSMLEGYQLIDRNVIPFGYKTVDQFHSELLLFRRK